MCVIVFTFTLSAQGECSEVTNHVYLFCIPSVTHSTDYNVAAS